MSEETTQNVPDPNGPPRSPVLSYQSKNLIKRTAQITVSGTLAAGVSVAAILVVGAVLVTPTSGAMRSHRITWEQRQKEIAEAQASSDTCGPMDPPTSEAMPTREPERPDTF